MEIDTGKRPDDLEYERTHTSNDLSQYIRLIRQTYILHHDFDPGNYYPRANNSWKWKHLLIVIWNSWDEDKEGSGLQNPVKSCKLLSYPKKMGKVYT